MTEIEKLDLTSLNIADEKRQELKRLLPEAFTEGGKIDFDKLKLTLGESVDVGKERYGLTWAGKADCFKIIQEPSIGTLVPVREESVNLGSTENLFIEGDNLEVLKLLQKSYLGKIKMIYIDPPYNTGNDFIYPDDYGETLDTYLRYTGQLDSQGRKYSTNTETDGRFHSKWLSMMYPRLFLARNLLNDNGAIFVSIDDKEVENLKKICNEVFGEENFVVQIEWQKRYTRSNNTDNFTSVIDHILLYSKSPDFAPRLLSRNQEADERYTNPDNDRRGSWKPMPFLNQVSPEQRPNLCYDIVNPSTGEKLYPTRKAWRSEKRVYEKYVAEGRVWWGKDGTAKVPSIKKFLAEARKGMTPINLWKHDFAGNTDDANREIIELFGDKVFDTPKPIQLIRRMIELTTTEDSNDTVLDFFAGSCTTAHAVLAQNQEDGGNRNFICVQLPQVVEETSVAYKNGLKTIAQIGKERIRKAIDKIKKDVNAHPDLFADRETDLDLGFGVYILSSSNFRIWDASIAKEKQAVEEQLALHIDHIDKKRSQEDILYELLLKTGFPLTTKVDQLTLAGKTVYSVSDGAMLICLERELTPEVIKAMAEKQPIRVVCLDEGFKGNDQLKTNAVQIMKSKNITMFRTV